MQVAVYLVGGNMMEAEGCLALGAQAEPVGACIFQQAVGADDIGLDECCRAIDRAVDMRLGGQVHDGVWLELAQRRDDALGIGNIGLNEAIPWACIDLGQRFQIAGIGQLVEVEHLVLGVLNQMADQRRSDEAGSAGNKNAHLLIASLLGPSSGRTNKCAKCNEQAMDMALSPNKKGLHESRP